jgi:hypothetical protein
MVLYRVSLQNSEVTTSDDGETYLAGTKPKPPANIPAIELSLRADRTTIGVFAILVLVGLAVYSSVAGWGHLSKQILQIASSLVAGLFAGVLVGERRASKDIVKTLRTASRR